MKREYSAGGAVYRKCDDSKTSSTQWLVCKHSGYHKWVLPKGIIEKGETPQRAAIREVHEECGIKSEIMRELMPHETYVYVLHGEKIFKTVTYYLMRYVSGNIQDHNWEMEDVAWLPFDEAYKKLEYKSAQQTLRMAQDAYEHTI